MINFPPSQMMLKFKGSCYLSEQTMLSTLVTWTSDKMLSLFSLKVPESQSPKT